MAENPVQIESRIDNAHNIGRPEGSFEVPHRVKPFLKNIGRETGVHSYDVLKKFAETDTGKKMAIFFEKKPPLNDSEGTSDQRRLREEEARMACRTLIESHIGYEDRQRESRAELKGMVAAFNERYGFTDQQVDIATDLVDAYYDHRRKGTELWNKYEMDDKDKYEANKYKLAHELTGADIPKGANVEVHWGPWGIEIIADNDVTNFVLYRGKTPPTDFVAGALADTAHVPPFILLNSGHYNKGTVRHEKQHIMTGIAVDVLKRHDIDVFGTEPLSEISLPPTHAQIEQDFRRERKKALHKAKDELFAYAFNAHHFPIRLFNAQNGNPYDYLKTQRDWATSQSNAMYQEASQRVFVAEYNAILSTAAKSFEMLIDKDKGGYSREEVIALLTDIPLEQWTKTAWRILETRAITLRPHEQKALSLPHAITTEHTVVRRPVEHKGGDQIFDVVISEDNKKPEWYDERSKMGKIKKAESATTHELAGEDDLSLAMVNKLLYDSTRLQVDFLNKIYGGRDLRDYFTILDEVTTERTKAYLQDGKVQQQDIAIAVGIVLSRLEEIYRRPQG